MFQKKNRTIYFVFHTGSVLIMGSKYEFACVDHVENDLQRHCSTLMISCDEGEYIQINKGGIYHGMITTSRPDGQCSNNITVCKTFTQGCCASDGYSSIENPSRDDSQPVRDTCDRKRECLIVPSELNFLRPQEFLMVHYICVKGKQSKYARPFSKLICYQE